MINYYKNSSILNLLTVEDELIKLKLKLIMYLKIYNNISKLSFMIMI